MILSGLVKLAHATDAEYRAWVQTIHDFLAGVGLVQTGDTGQINPATVLKPSVLTAPNGYEIWRLNDALQGASPVLFKIEYGASNPLANPMIWLTVGTATDGAGNLIGNKSTRLIGNTTPFTAPRSWYGSGDSSRFTIAIHPEVGDAGYWYFGIERTKDANGNDTGEGVTLFKSSYDSGNPGNLQHQTIVLTGGPIGGVEPFGTGDMPVSGLVSAVLGADVYTYAIRQMIIYPRNAQRNWVAYFNQDFLRETPIVLEIYGANSTYLPLGKMAASNQAVSQAGSAGGLANARLAMRYE